MAALFPPWTNTAFRLALILAALAAAAAVTAPMVIARSPFATGAHDPRLQPIAFDHRHHVLDDRIDCLYCHENAERGPYAGVPDTARCMGCHAQIWNDSPTLAPLRASAETGAPIRWERVHSLPDFVYFDHSIHVTRGIGCVTCHGRVDRMAAVEQVAPLTMSWCVDCHRAPERHLRPQSQITSTTWRPRPVDLVRLTATLRPRHLTYCSTCHR